MVLVHCNIVNNGYECNLRASCIFVPTESFDQLLDISPKNVIFLKTCNPRDRR